MDHNIILNASFFPVIAISLLTFFGYFVIRNSNEVNNEQITVSKKEYVQAIQLVSTNKKLEERLSNIRQPIAEIQNDIRNICERIDEIYSKLNLEAHESEESEDSSDEESEHNSISESENESDHEIKEIEAPKNTVFLRSMNRAGTFEST